MRLHAAAAPVSSYIHCGFPSRVAFTFKRAGLANLGSVPTYSSSSKSMLVPSVNSAWKTSYEPYWSFTLISWPDRMICKLHGWHCPSKERAKLWHRSDFLGVLWHRPVSCLPAWVSLGPEVNYVHLWIDYICMQPTTVSCLKNILLQRFHAHIQHIGLYSKMSILRLRINYNKNWHVYAISPRGFKCSRLLQPLRLIRINYSQVISQA